MISAKSGEHSGARSRRWRGVRRHGSHREGCTGGREEGRGREDSHVSSTSRTTEPRRVVPRPAEGVWPGLQDPGENRLRMTVARTLVRAAIRRLPLHLVWPDGSVEGDPRGPELRLIRPEAFFTRLGRQGLIGFGEGWMVGDWDSDDLVGVLRCLTDHVEQLVPRPLRNLRRVYDRGQPYEEVAADATVSRENVHRHYDLSNDLFSLFLDESMMYSAAWFDPARPAESLTDAQHRKIDGILDLAGVRAGQPRPRDRHRVGRGRDPRRAARRTGHDADALGRAGGARPRPRRAGRRLRPHHHRRARLPRGRRRVRLRDQHRDDRGRRRALLARVLRHRRPAARPRRSLRAPVDHDAAPPAPGDQGQLHLDPQVHLPRRSDPQPRGDRRDARGAHVDGGRRAPVDRPRLRRDAAPLAGHVPGRGSRRSVRSGSTRPSCGCGTSTSPTPRPGSPRGTWTTSSWASRGDRRHGANGQG